MKSKIEGLTEIELRVYAEIANASNKGVCNTPATVLRRKCRLSNYFYKKTLTELVNKRLISQELNCGGVPRVITLLNNK
jgi:hypothetical protein